MTISFFLPIPSNPLLRLGAIFALGLALMPLAHAETPAKTSALSNATILLIRHAEKPEDGPGLSPEGEKRAQIYADYFRGFQIEGKPLKIEHLFAAADSKNSVRPRLTLEPLSRALKLPLDLRFEADDWKALADDLHATDHGKCLLICWHHGPMPELLRALGANPAKLLEDSDWPKEVFNWVIVLRYDAEGRLMPGKSRRIKEQWAPK